jgi:hypothetical protein
MTMTNEAGQGLNIWTIKLPAHQPPRCICCAERMLRYSHACLRCLARDLARTPRDEGMAWWRMLAMDTPPPIRARLHQLAREERLLDLRGAARVPYVGRA